MESEFHAIVHPNMDGEGIDEDSGSNWTGRITGFKKNQKKNCKFFLKKLDYEILRPLFIYEYERIKMKKEDELVT